MIPRFVLCALAAALALPSAALEAPKDYAGQWTLGGVSEGDEVCILTLGEEAAIGGWTINIPQDCFDKLGVSTDIAAWTVYPDGGIGFIDPLRKRLLYFEASEIGGYVARPSEGEPITLDRVGAGVKELTEQERMSGRWVLMSLGETLCAWESTPSQDGMTGKLKVAQPCQKAWASRKIVAWQRVDGGLYLIDTRRRGVLGLRREALEGFFTAPEANEQFGFVRDWGN